MSIIPTSVTEEQFNRHILPFLNVARRGYECKIALYQVFNLILYRLHTGCQWKQLPMPSAGEDEGEKLLSWQAVYYHYSKWSRDGSLQRVWEHSIVRIRQELDMRQLNLDGSHTIAKKGGESVAYQGRKRAKTSNILPVTEGHGFVVGCTGIVAGNRHDAFDLKPHLQHLFKSVKRLGLSFAGAYFNADAAFDTADARKTCFNHNVIPNIPENTRNRKHIKRGRKRVFNPQVYKQRFAAERSFAWVDKFRALLVRFDRKDALFLAAHHLVFALINLRHLFALKV
jgi:transposase